jgi:hypothetical protein
VQLNFLDLVGGVELADALLLEVKDDRSWEVPCTHWVAMAFHFLSQSGGYMDCPVTDWLVFGMIRAAHLEAHFVVHRHIAIRPDVQQSVS